MVLVHGFSASSADKSICALAEALYQDDLDVLTYDARGHGRSGGICTVGASEHLDVAGAVTLAAAEAARQVPGSPRASAGLPAFAAPSLERPVVLLGVSMGAVAVARYLAADEESRRRGVTGKDDVVQGAWGVTGAVLVSAPARWRMRPSPLGIFSALLTKSLPGRWAARRWLGVRVARRWETGETVESVLPAVRCPVAIVHGGRDRLLGMAHAERLEAAAGGPCRLVRVAHMGHGIGGAGKEAARLAVAWVLAEASAPENLPPVELVPR